MASSTVINTVVTKGDLRVAFLYLQDVRGEAGSRTPRRRPIMLYCLSMIEVDILPTVAEGAALGGQGTFWFEEAG